MSKLQDCAKRRKNRPSDYGQRNQKEYKELSPQLAELESHQRARKPLRVPESEPTVKHLAASDGTNVVVCCLITLSTTAGTLDWWSGLTHMYSMRSIVLQYAIRCS